jgi:CHASE3 domain sensor protein
MKLSPGFLLRVAAVAIPFVIILFGAVLQMKSLLHAQKLARGQRQQIIFIQATYVAKLVDEAGSGIGAYTMTHMPLYAERFNKAYHALPRALEQLGELGPFDGDEAEPISQLKQAASETMATLAKVSTALANPASYEASAGARNFALYKSMKNMSEKIQGCMQRLTPEGGMEAFLQEEKQAADETNLLRILTIMWLVNSLLLSAGLIFILKQSGFIKLS